MYLQEKPTGKRHNALISKSLENPTGWGKRQRGWQRHRGTTGTVDSRGTTGTDDSRGTTETDDSEGTTETDDSRGTRETVKGRQGRKKDDRDGRTAGMYKDGRTAET